MLIDSHCHLDFPDLAKNMAPILALMKANDVACAVCIGVTLEDLDRVLALAEEWPTILASVGVHPEATGGREPSVSELVELARHPRVIAIGETGLDYYWHKDAPEWQRERFRTHIRAAREAQKPLVIHTREAAVDTLRLMKEEGAAAAGGVMHCFTETWQVAEQALEQGFYISMSGIVTFKKAEIVRDVARRVPLERLLVETDSPYLSPVPYRGRTNQPGYVKHVAEEVARLRGLTYQEVVDATTDNFFRLFPEARSKVSQ
ncbi:MAG: putative deoxyribonuclease YcfH [Candidatus Accumulibacter regalis]|jgi:TatD DNase family protein|uniref:Deoxyribonuclease YcfH n=1 Tax=Accumulibacter regalis TaxID=522306 RepID=A0A011QK18_ACCRE|nr:MULTISPECIES: TatD family hydrolase [unclassified Candidatus Accumulibacter]EXI89727.1 MAG: putative deoxyribonuclease YcfH [Candidatus Accumulibacter regalis]MQM33274.1 TatD family deoxyribonuclease [Candidatus Accumulibacter phosphatis]MBL8368978.1 TatD family hydrolase [Accumulibacter sp.]MBN8513219.1 TatD family hydrolase [Accumulibacter sp.]MBO3702575.1 TatD family hydrolase [Accumulibacter sp.]